jgi:SAM-dependent methyltransferase
LSSHFVCRERCPGCGSAAAGTLLDLPYDAPPVGDFVTRYYFRARDVRSWLAGGRYRLDRCGACGLVFQRFVGDDALLATLYGTWLTGAIDPDRDPEFRRQVAAPGQSRDGHELMAAAALLGRPVQSLRVLDYGMGWGLWALVAHGLGARAFGYDLAESRNDYVKRHGVTPVRLGELPGLGVDFINTEQVFEHLSAPAEVLALLASALAPGGILKISVPTSPDVERLLADVDWGDLGALVAVHPLEHVNCFDRGSIATMAAASGLAPVAIPLRAYLSFLRVPGAIPKRARPLAKAFARPVYHRFSRENVYLWLRRPDQAR